MVSLGRWATHIPNDGVARAVVGKAQHKVARYVRNGCSVGERRHVLVFVVRDNAYINRESASICGQRARCESHWGAGLSGPGKRKHTDHDSGGKQSPNWCACH